MKQYPSQARLRELFDYDPEGFLVWKSGPRKGRKAGSFGVNKDLRVFYDVRINKKLYSGAKLIFIFFKGFSPKYLYHKNHDQHDNRIQNLIASTTRSGHSAGHWKDFSREYRFVEQEKSGGSWYNTVGNKKWFTSIKAAAFYANTEIDRLNLNYHKNNVEAVDLEKFRCDGKRQVKNRNNNTSYFLGVSRHQKKWIVKCAHKYAGTYDTEEQAARAYNIAAYEHYGENAVLNDIPDPLGKGDVF